MLETIPSLLLSWISKIIVSPASVVIKSVLALGCLSVSISTSSYGSLYLTTSLGMLNWTALCDKFQVSGDE